MKAPLRELRTALLEADVALPVVKAFLEKVERSAAGVQARPSFCAQLSSHRTR